MIFRKLENGNVQLIDDGKVLASFQPNKQVFIDQERENAIRITDDTNQYQFVNGYLVYFSQIDGAGCTPVINAADVNELVSELSTNFFFEEIGGDTGSGSGLEIKTEKLLVEPFSDKTFTVSTESYLSTTIEHRLPPVPISISGIIDSSLVNTTFNERLIDGDLISVAYNPTPGNGVEAIFSSIDLGSQKTADIISVNIWSRTYLAQSYTVEFSNDNSTFFSPQTILGNDFEGVSFNLDASDVNPFRYVRLRAIAGAPAYVTVSSILVSEKSTEYYTIQNPSFEDFEITDENGFVKIINKSDREALSTVKYIENE